jgi:hypothetical protein
MDEPLFELFLAFFVPLKSISVVWQLNLILEPVAVLLRSIAQFAIFEMPMR